MKNIHKKLAVLSISILTVVSVSVLAKGPSGQAGKSNVGHLYLHEKNPQDWTIVEKGAWGKMQYNLSGEEFEFVFNGHALKFNTDYTLIYYPDPWPGNGLICLGSDLSNNGSNVHIKNSVDTCDMPAVYDENYPDGAKIWLVLSEDVDCEQRKMIGWRPTEYLFEYQLITFEDIDCERYCGNGILDPAEECDDGENNGIQCTPSYGTPCTYCSDECKIVENQNYAYCGDGNLDQPQEECDDGNNADGDGCSAICTIEQAQECIPGEQESCDTGQLGICAAGTKTCGSDGFWGECIRNNEPVNEDPFNENCGDGLDNDCDGLTDMEEDDCSAGGPT